MILVSSLSKSFLLEALESEQIQTAFILYFVSVIQAFSDCPKRAILGTMNKISPLPPVSCSMISKEVYVFPVPQAMISFPRSCTLKYSWAAFIASNWCLRGCLPSRKAAFPVSPFKSLSQSTGEASNSCILIRVTEMSWPFNVSSAFAPQRKVVETQIRLLKYVVFKVKSSINARWAVDIKESTTALLMTAFSS